MVLACRRVQYLAVVSCCLSVFAGCGSSDAGCVDLDLDGFGDGCAAGTDCDDRNALRNVDCDSVPEPDCTTAPLSTGCPCLTGASTTCFPGPEGSAEVGICRSGVAQCINQRWGICNGSQLPRFETCDSRDQDCDGLVDEGVASPCGDCDPQCIGALWGGVDFPFDSPPLSAASGLELTEDDWLTLAWQQVSGGEFVWVPSSADGTVSKIDPVTNQEVARYAVGAEPSRVAVDYEGNAWIANREFDGVPSVTKIAASAAACDDRDGSSTIETSSGPSNVLASGEDECVLFTVPAGPAGSIARALAIDGSRSPGPGGNAWVGLHQGEEVVVLSGLDGTELDRFAVPGFQPYGANFDRFGSLWLNSQDGFLTRVDRDSGSPTTTRIEVPFDCFLTYSFAIHANGDLFLSGHHCDQVLRFDPLRGLWSRLASEASTRGVTVSGNDVLVSHTGGLLSRISADPFRVEAVVDLQTLGATPIDAIGLSVDQAGAAWIASGQGGASGAGVATKVADDAVAAHVEVGAFPHTQGDLTGSQLLGGFEPQGEIRRVFAGCGTDDTVYERVHLAALPGANGSVRVEGRHAADLAALTEASFQDIGRFPAMTPPYTLSFPEGGVLELRVTLETDARDGAPRVQQVGLEWECPGPI